MPAGGRAMPVAVINGATVTGDDYVLGDDDGVLFFPARHRDELFQAARDIQRNETAQADEMRAGRTLRQQLDFDGYKKRQADDPDFTLRRHLLERGNSIEV